LVFVNYIADLPPEFNLLAVVTAILVGVAKTGVSGMAILVVPLIAMVFPAKESVGALLPMLITGDILAVIYYRQHAQWGQLVKLVPGVAAGMLVGALFLARLDNESMRIFLGIFVLLLLIIEWITRYLNLNEFKKLHTFAFLIGIMAGFGTTVGNSAGPIMGIYLIMMGLDKRQLMGTGAWFFLIVNTSKLPIFIYHGMIVADILRFFAFMVPFIVLGTYFGRRLLTVLSQQIFDILVLLFAALSSLWLLFF
jgi:uncharacterized membrane protein YfcA